MAAGTVVFLRADFVLGDREVAGRSWLNIDRWRQA
jgi:hypothetical protein